MVNNSQGDSYSRRKYLLTTGMLAGAGLAGCLSNSDSADETTQETGAGGNQDGKTQITYHDRYEWVKQYSTTFNQTAENINVKTEVDPTTSSGAYQGVIAQISAGNAPEVIGLDVVQLAKFVNLGALQQLNSFVDSLDYFNDVFEPLRNDFVSYDGNKYGMPFWIDLSMYYYNKRLFEDAGLDPESPPETWAEYKQANEQLGSTAEYGTASSFGGFFYFPTAWANGAQLFSDDGSKCTMDSQAAVDALKFWVDLNSSDATTDLISTEWQTAHDLFVDEKAAMVHSGGYALGYARDKNPQLIENDNLGVAMLPKPSSDATRTSFLGGNAITITKQAAKSEARLKAAKEFVKWVNSEEGMKVTLENGYFPARKSGFDLPTATENQDLFAPFKTALSQGHAPPIHPDFREVSTELFAGMQRALNGDQSAKQALTQTVNRINSNILS